MKRARRIPVLAVAVLGIVPAGAGAQDRPASGDVEAYFRGVGEHFRVPSGEVGVLSAWGLLPEEVPVVLFMARHAGVAPDVVASQRRGGRPWARVAGGIGLDAGVFHVVLPPSTPHGLLASAYARFDATPRSDWPSIELSDPEVVGLVNIQFIGSALGVPPARVLEAAARTGSWVAAFRALVRSR